MTEPVPGIGIMTGERRKSHARATCDVVAPSRFAASSSRPPGCASSPAEIGAQGAAPFLSKLTYWLAAGFMITSLAIEITIVKENRSVLDKAPAIRPAPAPAPLPAAPPVPAAPAPAAPKKP